MPVDTTADTTANRTEATRARKAKPRWRYPESRTRPKILAKRVTEADHAALTRYAEDQGSTVAQLLEPFVSDLIKLAHEHCDEQFDDAPSSVAS